MWGKTDFYTAKSDTEMLQVVTFTILLQLLTKLLISSSCNKSVKIRLVATCHLKTRYNLLKELVVSLWITSFDN